MDDQVGVIARAEGRPREAFGDASRGDVSWVTLFSRDVTPTERMSAGIAELAPHGGCLNPHRHAEPEIYLILEGAGIVTIAGTERPVTAGAAVFIPGDAEHGIRNEGATTLRFFYVFPVDRFSEVTYRFPETRDRR